MNSPTAVLLADVFQYLCEEDTYVFKDGFGELTVRVACHLEEIGYSNVLLDEVLTWAERNDGMGQGS